MLLGREPERQALDRVLASARSGRSAVLALVGEPGIGKTALLGYAAEEAGGMRVLRARGIESESHVPFAGLFELLRPALRLLGKIPEPQATALEGALALRPGVGSERFAIGAATLSLLAAYAEEEPALVLVDDAHLLDESSAEALRFALRRLLAEPVAAVLAARDGEPSLLDGADLPSLRIGGLDAESAAALLGAVPPPVAERLYRETAGNPLALLELAGEAVQLGAAPIPVPAKVSRAFLRRADALDEPARRLLALAATDDAGDITTLERAAGALGLELAALAAGEREGLIRTQDGRVEFRHPLARAAIYAEAPPEQRREAHRALAAALPDRDIDRRAWHLAAAALGADDAAAAALEQAGARARDRSAYAVAAAAFERAARLAPEEDRRGRLLLAAAESAWLAGLADRSLALVEEAHELGAEGTDHLRGRLAARRGPVMDGYAVLVAAARRAEPDLAVAMLAEAIDAAFFAGAIDAMMRAAELLPRGTSPRARFLAAIAGGMARVMAGDGQRGIDSIRDGVQLAERSPELGDEDELLPWLVMGPLYLREADAGRALVEAAIASARARTALGVLPRLLNRIARDHAAASAWDTAAVEYDEAARLARETGQTADLASALAGLAWMEARRGEEEACRVHAAEARELCARLGMGLYDTWALRGLAELELGLGRAEAAATRLEELSERLAELGIDDVDLSPAPELVDVYLRLGRVDDAWAVAARLEDAAQAKGQPWALARAARCRGHLEVEFAPRFDLALELHAQTADAFETACTRLAYGARLRRARRRIRAREELRAALAAFESLGAAPWSELARQELAATGETARRRDASTLDALTPQELHIARLLAGGRTTREAAAALFLSPKTIEYHLRHVYRKLGVGSRAELAAALGSRDGQ
jgi:DNA-binding CsgD family transcriptional regulator